tara:strand:+ start:25442 stop:25843 length:402 start_codon:yes stop_codon:yes gene_type:complete
MAKRIIREIRDWNDKRKERKVQTKQIVRELGTIKTLKELGKLGRVIKTTTFSSLREKFRIEAAYVKRVYALTYVESNSRNLAAGALRNVFSPTQVKLHLTNFKIMARRDIRDGVLQLEETPGPKKLPEPKKKK